MFGFRSLIKQIDQLNNQLEKINLQELLTISGNKREILKRNFIAGLGRGIGIGIGVTIITAILIIILEEIVTLNIPVIGKYIAEIVKIVENNQY